MTVETLRPLLPVLTTLAAFVGILLASRRPNLREGVSFAGAAATFLAVAAMAPDVLAGRVLACTVSRIAPGIALSFRVDGLSLVFALVSSFLWVFATSYNIGYLRSLKEHDQTRFYACFAMAILGAQGVAVSGSLFTLYLFYEVITVCTYPLVAHHGDAEAREGGRKYLVYLMGTSKGFLLPAMALTWALTGTLEFGAGTAAGIFPAGAGGPWLALSYALFIMGFAKAAIMPFHNWLPSAMVAPTPVSALLHAVAVVKAGVFSVARVMLSVYGTTLLGATGLGTATAWVAGFTVVTASLIALTKDDLKARLAYSTVSQLSYVVLGVALLDPAGVTGGLLHIANHAFGKITLFFCAGAIYVAAHRKKISDLDGLGRAMPWTMGAFFVASLTMIGVPPVAGFVSKWYMVNGALRGSHGALAAVFVLSTLLNTAYFIPISLRAFLAPAREGAEAAHEAPAAMVVPLVAAAAISVLLGVFPGVFAGLVEVFLR